MFVFFFSLAVDDKWRVGLEVKGDGSFLWGGGGGGGGSFFLLKEWAAFPTKGVGSFFFKRVGQFSY